MARRLRLPLLLVLAAAVLTSVLLTPARADSIPYCYSENHYVVTLDVKGTTSSNCGPIQYCTIGHQTHEWDCVRRPDGTLYPTNYHAWTPVFCYCNNPGYTFIKCC